mmetsp:Transcript_29631/g.99746  ORF Transcript_29631/g.99746 Transcript_29631/m.99746 type:complete len:227 (+) Transcript_29631:70-750(+)
MAPPRRLPRGPARHVGRGSRAVDPRRAARRHPSRAQRPRRAAAAARARGGPPGRPFGRHNTDARRPAAGAGVRRPWGHVAPRLLRADAGCRTRPGRPGRARPLCRACGAGAGAELGARAAVDKRLWPAMGRFAARAAARRGGPAARFDAFAAGGDAGGSGPARGGVHRRDERIDPRRDARAQRRQRALAHQARRQQAHRHRPRARPGRRGPRAPRHAPGSRVAGDV